VSKDLSHSTRNFFFHLEYPWNSELFQSSVPDNFFKDEVSLRDYLEWLGEQLEIKEMEGWYEVTTNTFVRMNGGALLRMDRSIPKIIMDNFPGYLVKELHNLIFLVE
jgi:hypothetical protein